MNTIFFRTQRTWLGLLLILASQSYALPPLGLTQVSTSAILRPNLELIDGTAYLGVSSGVWSVDSFGTTSFVPISHPTLGTPSSVTRVVKAFDGELYVAANFTRPALYRLDVPLSPIVTWVDGIVKGVDAQLRTLGNVHKVSTVEASQFRLDGSIHSLAYPPINPNSGINIKYTQVDFVTPSGYAIGASNIPGTIGSAPAQWTPAGEFSFILGNGFPTSSRDHNDLRGVNVGFLDFNPTVRLDENYYEIEDMNGERYPGDGAVLVSHTNFTIVQDYAFPANYPKEAYFPGIVPGFPNRAAPLLDIFPELATIDIDAIHDLASVDGFLYMTLSGDDGTYLFGARDPSVVVPEPATAVILFLAATVALRSRSR